MAVIVVNRSELFEPVLLIQSMKGSGEVSKEILYFEFRNDGQKTYINLNIAM